MDRYQFRDFEGNPISQDSKWVICGNPAAPNWFAWVGSVRLSAPCRLCGRRLTRKNRTFRRPRGTDARTDFGLERTPAMNRLLWIGTLALLLVASTGCQMGGCGAGSCSSGACGQGSGDCGDCGGCNDCGPVGIVGKLKARRGGGGCGSGNCGSGILGKLCGMCGCGSSCGGDCGGTCGDGNCGCGGRTGCRAGALGWQQGGLDYSSHLQPGLLGHNAPAALNNRPFTPGPPSAQVGYPYYSHHGPRDFLLDNPPTIGR